jgi:hypothetical protein
MFNELDSGPWKSFAGREKRMIKKCGSGIY